MIQNLEIIMAERQGFEPWEGVTFAGFQDRCFRPLSHLSELTIYIMMVQPDVIEASLNVLRPEKNPGPT